MARVLIVEDEVLIGLVLEDILDMLGHRVVGNAASVGEGDSLVTTLGAASIDLAVLDVNVGAEAVWPLADRIAGAGVRLIFATGSHPDSLPERFAGCAVLEKPYAVTGVEAVLARVGEPAGHPALPN